MHPPTLRTPSTAASGSAPGGAARMLAASMKSER
jgi:hypothetical protein